MLLDTFAMFSFNSVQFNLIIYYLQNHLLIKNSYDSVAHVYFGKTCLKVKLFAVLIDINKKVDIFYAQILDVPI